jgi:hypothetical protein
MQQYGLLFFFPPPGTRAILMSSDPMVPDQVVRQLQSLLGVEIRPISLSPGARAALGQEYASRKSERPKGWEGRRARTGPAGGGEDQPLLQALVNLLIKKELVTPEELQVEVELLRRRSKETKPQGTGSKTSKSMVLRVHDEIRNPNSSSPSVAK